MASLSTGIAQAAQTGTTSVENNGFANLSSAEFFKVMFTELQNQDPLEPTDTSAMLEQLSTIRNIESQVKLQSQLEDMVASNQIAIAGGLIGKVVEGRDENLNLASGKVNSIRITGDDIMLELENGQRVSMSNLLNIEAAPEPAPPAGS
jgi:flagellar basal-body rod modification protein FlgD